MHPLFDPPRPNLWSITPIQVCRSRYGGQLGDSTMHTGLARRAQSPAGPRPKAFERGGRTAELIAER